MGCHWDGRPWKLATSTPGSVIAEVLSLPAHAQTRARGGGYDQRGLAHILAGPGHGPGVSFRHFAGNCPAAARLSGQRRPITTKRSARRRDFAQKGTAPGYRPGAGPAARSDRFWAANGLVTEQRTA